MSFEENDHLFNSFFLSFLQNITEYNDRLYIMIKLLFFNIETLTI